LGESRKIEERRLLKERVKEILKGSDRGVIREIKRGGRGYLAGTTKFQRRMRKNTWILLDYDFISIKGEIITFILF